VTRTVVHFVDSDTFGGSEQSLLHLLAGLDRARWRPVLLHHPAAELARLVAGARAAGVLVRAVPRVGDRRGLWRLPALLHAVAAERPDVFHAHLNWPLACKFGLAAAALARVPAVVATVQLFVDSLVNRNVRAQVRAVSLGVDRYFAVSEHVRDRLAAGLHLPVRKLRVVYNGIDPGPFGRPADPALRAALAGSDPARPIVLAVARLSPQKGLDVLVDAAAQVPDAAFVVAGGGPERAVLEARARDRGVAARVTFLGPREDVPALLAACDVFVLPSLFEGLPLSVLEAMAAERPVVASRIGGTGEAVVDGCTGRLVPPGDPAALAAAIRELLARPDLARRYAAAGRARLEERFTARRMVEKVSAEYEELRAR